MVLSFECDTTNIAATKCPTQSSSLHNFKKCQLYGTLQNYLVYGQD